MTDLNELDARIAKFKKQLEDDGVLTKDWALWDAEHQGDHDKAYDKAYSQANGYAEHVGRVFSDSGETRDPKDTAAGMRIAATSHESAAQGAAANGDSQTAARESGKAEALRDAASDWESGKTPHETDAGGAAHEADKANIQAGNGGKNWKLP